MRRGGGAARGSTDERPYPECRDCNVAQPPQPSRLFLVRPCKLYTFNGIENFAVIVLLLPGRIRCCHSGNRSTAIFPPTSNTHHSDDKTSSLFTTQYSTCLWVSLLVIVKTAIPGAPVIIYDLQFHENEIGESVVLAAAVTMNE